MERLTHTMTVRMDGNDDFVVMKEDLNKAFNKLGRLERIEQELGIPLEVLFKALKDGIHIVETNKQEIVKIIYDDYLNKWRMSDYNENIINLEKYGEEWY